MCARTCLCVLVCMRVGLVQAATSANTLWKTNSVGVDGVSRQRSSSDLPAVHPPLPPLRVTSTSTFFFLLLFPFLPVGLMNLENRGHCWQPLGGDRCGLPTGTYQMLPVWPQPLQFLPQALICSLTPLPRWLTLFSVSPAFNNILSLSTQHPSSSSSCKVIWGWSFQS